MEENDALEKAQDEGTARACEVLRRTFIWVAEAPQVKERGLRSMVVLYCIDRDLLDDATLEKIGTAAGVTRQAVHKLVNEYRATIGL